MSVKRPGIIVIIVFECLSRLEFQLFGLSIQVTPGVHVATPLNQILLVTHSECTIEWMADYKDHHIFIV